MHSITKWTRILIRGRVSETLMGKTWSDCCSPQGNQCGDHKSNLGGRNTHASMFLHHHCFLWSMWNDNVPCHHLSHAFVAMAWYPKSTARVIIRILQEPQTSYHQRLACTCRRVADPRFHARSLQPRQKVNIYLQVCWKLVWQYTRTMASWVTGRECCLPWPWCVLHRTLWTH